jgi:hypothetical protein
MEAAMRPYWRMMAAVLVVLALVMGAACGPAEVITEEPIVEEPVEEPTEAPTEAPTVTTMPPRPATATNTLEPNTPGPSTPEPTATATETQDLLALLLGPWDIRTSYSAGNRQHFGFILLPEAATIEVKQGSIIFDGTGNWVDVTGDLQTDGAFEAEGMGTVAGFPNVSVVFTGTLLLDGLTGYYTMGAAGELPGGESITYLVEGTKSD